ncbi:MAG: FAD-dependent oxidoreductase, partial [Spirochaetales bacterium]|nr:FAD-dependent oxidoreductase [Spirochaetales bacterium]
GREAIAAEVVIDATGDGDVAAKAGAPYFKGRESDGKMQPMSLMFKLAGVDFDSAIFPRGPRRTFKVPAGEAQALAAEHLPTPMGYLVLHKSPRMGIVTCNITRELGADGTSAEDLTRAHINCRRQIEKVVEFLKKYIPGYEECFLISSAPMIGVRETRHFEAEYSLTEEDIKEGKIFPDWVVAKAHYPFDVHNLTGKGWLDKSVKETFDKGPPPEGYTIPYRCFVPKTIDRLLLAGRAISGTHVAHSSFRVMSICANMGQAAGIAAALCTANGVAPRDLDVKKIQDALIKQGVEP